MDNRELITEQLISDMEWYFGGKGNSQISLSGIATHLINKGYTRPEPAESQVDAATQILQQLLNDWCSAGNGERLILDAYAHSILNLQPELKLLETNPYPVTSRFNDPHYADKWLHDGYEKGKRDQLAHDQKQKGEQNE